MYKVYKKNYIRGENKGLWYDYDRFNLDMEQIILVILSTELQSPKQCVIFEVNVDLKVWGMFDIVLWYPRGSIVVYGTLEDQ